ncbi:MAG: hypothetical protein CL933_08745 [Deltaproteobacteria bacterium]|nr:hypothetical protein [Deltaproteobacteria bacterium]
MGFESSPVRVRVGEWVWPTDPRVFSMIDHDSNSGLAVDARFLDSFERFRRRRVSFWPVGSPLSYAAGEGRSLWASVGKLETGEEARAGIH